MARHFYFIVESGLDEPKTSDLWLLFEGIVGADPPQDWPCYRNHWRYRLDGNAGIFEAFFDDAAVNPNAMQGRLTSASKVPPPKQVVTEDPSGQYGPSYEYRHIDTDQMLMNYIVCGGDASNWEESRQATLAYLKEYQDEWETSEL